MDAGLIGAKLGHSMSPQIHEAYGRLTGQSIRYSLHETDAQGLEALLARLKLEGYAGVNVTIPHKVAVTALLEAVSPEAAAIGAVNTVRFDGERGVGYNTDYFGLRALLERNDIPVRGMRVAILGSGGAARCALALMRDLGAAKIVTVSRDPGKADPALCAVGYDTLEAMGTIDVLINTTPSGMHPDIDGYPVSESVIQKSSAIADLIYNPPETRLLQQAALWGKRCAGGLYMLCAQALKAEEIWTGVPYDAGICETIHLQLTESMRTNIVLIGMPGSGKTEIGRMLAEMLDMSFLDTDVLIEADHGAIKDIFATQGEAAFRELEREAAQYAARRSRTVIATGGGIVQTHPAMRALRASGHVVYIDRPLELLLKETETAHRPLLADGREALTGLYEKRKALYEGYEEIAVKNDSDLEQCVSAIIQRVEEYNK